ncbi:VEGFC factor, partial [Atractosteus spatula]|nr:VEGFC factor [Atractosteus spatula]
MHLLGLSLFLVYAVFLYRDFAFESGHDYYDYDQDQGDTKDHATPDLEERLRSVSSVDELMKIVYPNYWTMLKCQSKRGGRMHFRDQGASDSRTEEPLIFAAAFYNFEILKSIESEWRKTLCMPREVCLDVGKEFGAATNTFYKPPCVSVYRCGGCCNSEEYQCRNLSTSYISKTLFEITIPLSQEPKPVTISFANHTLCRCLSKLDVYRQVHSIIRRSLPEFNSNTLFLWGENLKTDNKVHNTKASALIEGKKIGKKEQLSGPRWKTNTAKNEKWNFLMKIVAKYFNNYSSFSGFDDICGPNKELDEETCQCVCKGHQRSSSCGPNRELDGHSCQCVCKLLPTACGPNKVFDKDTCQCACTKVCPKNQPLNPTKCACECTESPNKCFLRGRRFHHPTCSCYRPPCEVRRRRCEPGFYFSEEVCRCIPTYWRRLD